MLYMSQNNILTKTITKTLLLTVVTLPLWHCNGPKSSVSELADQSIHSAVANQPEPGPSFYTLKEFRWKMAVFIMLKGG